MLDNNGKISWPIPHLLVPRIVFGDHTRILKLINFNFARGADGTQVLLSNSPRLPQHLFYQCLLRIDLSNYGYARHFKFLKDKNIVLPDEKTSEKYEDFCKTNFNRIKDSIFQNIKLAALRDWLLPMLMNGQVSVGKAYEKVEDVLNVAAEKGSIYEKLG